MKKIDLEKMKELKKQQSIEHRVSTLLSEDTPFSISEAYKTTRTNITFALGTVKGGKKVIFTSANPGEGKTTTILNIAIAFAQTNTKVLVIDGDLRRPRIYRHLRLQRENGLSDVLCNLIDVDSAICRVEKYGFDCINAGQIPPNPAELLASDAMKDLLDKLSERYDYILIDTPPVTYVTDAAVMSRYVDGVIIVARQNSTIVESLEKSRENLIFADAKILGYVLNDVTSTNRYYYRGYNQYGYNYEYSYGYGDDINK